MEESSGHGSIWNIKSWSRPFPSSIFSVLCTVIYDITILLWMGSEVTAHKSWGPIAVSCIGFCSGIPVLILGPLAGAIVDRSDKKKVIINASIVQAATALVMFAVVIYWRHLPTTLVLFTSFLSVIILTSAAQFFSQARMSMIATTIPIEYRNTAFSILGSVSSVTQIVGPPLAAPLLFSVGPAWAIASNSLSFLVTAVTYKSTEWDSKPSLTEKKVTFLASIREGFNVIASDPFLRSMLAAVTITGLVLGVTEVLEIYFVSQSLREPQKDLGILMMFLAIGTFIGTTLSSQVGKKWDMAHIFISGLVATGALLFILSRTTTLTWACIVELLLAIPLGVVNTLFSPMIMGKVNEDMVGRVFGVFNVLPTAANLLSITAGGIIVSTILRNFHAKILGLNFHPVDTIYSISGIILIIVAIIVRKSIIANYKISAKISN